MNPGGRPEDASPSWSTLASALDRVMASTSDPPPQLTVTDFPGPVSPSDNIEVAASVGFPPLVVEPDVATLGSSVLNAPDLHGSSPATLGVPGSTVLSSGFSVEHVVSGSSSSVVALPSLNAPASPLPPHARTRLQNNIVKPKGLFPGMIRYANFCSMGEPESIQ
jgi:hypothetical protein